MTEIPLSQLVESVRNGDSEASDKLANSFFGQALFLAQKRLPKSPSPMVDHEDLAISALRSFCLRIRDGRIEYRGDKELVGVLKTIIRAKTNRLFEHHFAEKRDSRRLVSIPGNVSAEHPADELSLQIDGVELVIDSDERPSVARILDSLQTELHDLFRSLVSILDEHPRRAMLLLLENDLNNQQLAERLGRSVASVERYRQLIREKLTQLTQ